jgi:endo-1,4-beta-xylanase
MRQNRVAPLKSWRAILFLSALPAACFSALPHGENLLPEGGLSAFEIPAGNPQGSSALATEEGTQVLRLEVKAEGNVNPWDFQVAVPIAQGVKAGDRILADFWMRGLKSRAESAESVSEFVFERSVEPWTKSVSYPLGAAGSWRHFDIPFEAAENYGSGGGRLIFRLGYAPESFEIRNLSVVNYATSVPLSALPRTRITYDGRDSKAPWRRQAEADILKYRTAAVQILVLDHSGKPLEGAAIEAVQTKSAFHFGTAVSGHYAFIDSDAAGRAAYEEKLRTYFNMATEENALKWAPLAGDWGKDWSMDLAQRSADWVRGLGLDFRAHNLIWPSWRNMPRMAEALKSDPKALRNAVFDHINTVAEAMRGRALQWDVMNEPFDNHDLMDILGDKVMGDFFKAAHRADPDAELFVNDYAILSGGGGDTPHRQHYEKTIRYLIAQGAPLDGIGMQGHFGNELTSPADLRKLLDRYAHYGKKIMITEFDIDVDDPELAADYMRDLLTIAYSHPAVEGFVMWGFWDGAHWHHKAPLFNQDWSPKPAAKVWEDLVLNRWRSRLSGRSDGRGRFASEAHLGDYRFSASMNGATATAQAALGSQGLKVTLRLP